MNLPYHNATSKTSLIDLQKMLSKFGCQSFGVLTDTESGEIIVQFRWRGQVVQLRASWKGYALAWLRAHPQRRSRCSRADYEAKAFAQAQISVQSLLRDWAKAQLTAIECGVMDFETAFMPHMLLPSGERLIDRVQGLLPAPLTKPETHNVT